jgi:hypothetical protein
MSAAIRRPLERRCLAHGSPAACRAGEQDRDRGRIARAAAAAFSRPAPGNLPCSSREPDISVGRFGGHHVHSANIVALWSAHRR